jgi:hypothetical protein
MTAPDRMQAGGRSKQYATKLEWPTNTFPQSTYLSYNPDYQDQHNTRIQKAKIVAVHPPQHRPLA